MDGRRLATAVCGCSWCWLVVCDVKLCRKWQLRGERRSSDDGELCEVAWFCLSRLELVHPTNRWSSFFRRVSGRDEVVGVFSGELGCSRFWGLLVEEEDRGKVRWRRKREGAGGRSFVLSLL
uniref:Uncharacterized protein n=1 Tax=Nicotiana tabacum TaxID=4097 RepID=A0A1S4DJR2_TOBAC|nr:PREDICTED: uncharacterized protein LOC107830470 [Nicotiana tabacum]